MWLCHFARFETGPSQGAVLRLVSCLAQPRDVAKLLLLHRNWLSRDAQRWHLHLLLRITEDAGGAWRQGTKLTTLPQAGADWELHGLLSRCPHWNHMARSIRWAVSAYMWWIFVGNEILTAVTIQIADIFLRTALEDIFQTTLSYRFLFRSTRRYRAFSDQHDVTGIFLISRPCRNSPIFYCTITLSELYDHPQSRTLHCGYLLYFGVDGFQSVFKSAERHNKGRQGKGGDN
jgi:hypothetical protein